MADVWCASRELARAAEAEAVPTARPRRPLGVFVVAPLVTRRLAALRRPSASTKILLLGCAGVMVDLGTLAFDLPLWLGVPAMSLLAVAMFRTALARRR